MRPSLPFLSLATLLGTVFLTFTVLAAPPPPEESEPSETNDRPRLQCKCLPDQPCWPSSSTWSAFNQTVGGNLIATTPVAQACHPSHYDQARCDEIKKNYSLGAWRQEQPGAVFFTNWETVQGQGCLLNQTATAPCVQGAVPVFSVKATTAADVQATVQFAAQHNLRLVVKNTGHDFLGRSSGPSSISLWVHHMKKIQVVDAFVPEGAPPATEATDAVILEAGVVWHEAYKAVDAHNRTVVGGAAPTVGTSGGYCLSGGHGPLAPLYGLCVDNVLQYKVVTADGELRVANAYQNQDLFWAMRGGGPGFGVVVEAVYRTHPAVTINFVMAVIYSDVEAQFDLAVRDYYARQVAWSDAGWAGYGFVGRNYMAMTYVLANRGLDQARADFDPFLDHARTIPNVIVSNVTYHQFSSYQDYFEHMTPMDSEQNAGLGAVLGSRLIPRTLLASKEGADQLTSTMRQLQTDTKGFSDQYLTLLVAGGQVAKGTAKETSVHPGWRKALMLVIAPGGWTEGTEYPVQQAIQQAITRATDPLRALTPGAGTYLNEADANEPNFQQSFFGTNYPRLRRIKTKYDPRGLFVCRRCVGSEDWNDQGLCPRRR